MDISVFGLGYVGCVSAACLARLGHRVIGVDVSSHKIDLIQSGQSTIVEDEIGDLVKDAVRQGRLSATVSALDAIHSTEISLVCVGTPSNENGSLDLNYIKACCGSIGEGLKRKRGYHVVVIRSTMLPGSLRGVVLPILEASSGKKAGDDFGLCMNPEFLREGSSVRDFHQPPYTVIGAVDERCARVLGEMYRDISAPVMKTTPETAEMIKYASNSFHAVKICFANEMGRLGKSAGVDAHQLMELFCRDEKLNISRAYFRPGFAFGGSCLPKDVRAITYFGRTADVDTPLLNSLMASNQAHLQQALRMIERGGRRNVGLVGLAFKPGTDDLRESPLVLLAEYLLGRGFPLRIYDVNVQISNIFGANRQYIEKEIPHIEKLMVPTLSDLIAFADVLVLGHRNVELHTFPLQNKEVIELERPELRPWAAPGQGIGW
ncbi:MAG TPA: nucleotide sugar dehydrogenase [bacterium]